MSENGEAPKNYDCPICGHKMNNRKTKSAHMSRKHNNVHRVCDRCGEQGVGPRHRERCNAGNDTVECKYCPGKTFTRLTNLYRHHGTQSCQSNRARFEAAAQAATATANAATPQIMQLMSPPLVAGTSSGGMMPFTIGETPTKS